MHAVLKAAFQLQAADPPGSPLGPELLRTKVWSITTKNLNFMSTLLQAPSKVGHATAIAAQLLGG